MKIISDKYLQFQINNAPPDRVVAGLFYIAGVGYIFFDVGWDDAALKPYHVIGEMIKEEKSKWVFKDDKDWIVTITEIADDDELYRAAEDWFNYVREKGIDETQMKNGLAREFDIAEEKIETCWLYQEIK